MTSAAPTVDQLDSPRVTPFTPPRWLSNPHLQSILPGLRVRRLWLLRRARDLLAASDTQILDCGDGVRLLGHYSGQSFLGRPAAKQLVVLLHGWEGSAESLYVLSLGSQLFAHGCDVYRLNFRDHGPSHHLNEDLFHSCRLNEVLGALRRLQHMYPEHRLAVAGFSLGGNFAMRVAAQAPNAGLRLERAIAICPVLRPHSTMDLLERGSFVYRQYFIAKWKRSLQLKQRLFPQRFDFTHILAQNSLKLMTELLVSKYSEFPNLDAYLNGYSIIGDVLADLRVPSHVLFALDDPIIPAEDLRLLAPSPALDIIAVPHGGHCGFIDRLGAPTWADRSVTRLLTA